MKQPIDIGGPGLIPDMPDVILPDGAWTEGRNIRFREGAAERVKGYRNVFNSASATAIWVEPVNDGLVEFWVYGNEQYLYATDGSAHAQVSSITYTATALLGYTGGAFHGRMVANDAVNAPQVWIPSLANKFEALSHWPASTICDVIRPFGDFLVAMRLNESGTYNPRMIRWSDKAGAGGMPQSWDYTDPTNQAGRTELGQTPDKIIDCLPLRDSNIVYKQFHTWLMTYVGGLDVFSFRQAFSQAGLLTENCVKAFGPRHFAVTDSDVVMHDGNDAQSLVDKRLRRWLFNALSTDRFQASFVAADYRDREMWFCFPESGNSFPNLAAVWNWQDDSWHVRDLGEQMAHASSGIVESSGVTFDADPGEFDTGPAGTFDEYDVTPWSQRMVMAPATRPGLVQGNTTYQWAGRSMICYAARTNMALTKDVGKIKRIKRIFPRLVGVAGDVVRFRVGSQYAYDNTIALQGPFLYTIGTDHKIDCRVDGRMITLHLEYRGDNPLRLAGFDIEYDHTGDR